LAQIHDVENPFDWNSIRRFPSQLPAAAWARINADAHVLRLDDAGWLLDAARANPSAFMDLSAGDTVVSVVRSVLQSDEATLSLEDWVAFTKNLSRNDPRRSEWTALEIVRHVLKPLFLLEGQDADFLDRLHPANVRIPLRWRDLPGDLPVGGRVTWEGWRGLASSSRVTVNGVGLRDYRFSEISTEEDRSWPRRLRPIGQLLWGILRESFSLPAAWNIRGQERSFVELVAWDLERLPISSFTLSILQSCLLPRGRETSLLLEFPELFGLLGRQVADDTKFDRPIGSPDDLNRIIGEAQSLLQDSQITILEHEPRQLIPVRLRQMAVFVEAAPDAGVLQE
jgi:hypothetical protein